jgi:hypothetical protein
LIDFSRTLRGITTKDIPPFRNRHI